MTFHKLFAVLAITWVLAVPAVHAQDQQPQNGNNPTTDPTQPVAPLPPQENNADDRQTPAPAARGLFLSVNSQDQNGGQIQPDTHALSGAVTPGLGFSQKSHRLLDPAFRLSEGADSGIVTGHTDSVTSIGGSFSFDQAWKLYHFAAAYSGSQTFYVPDSSLSQAYHNASVSQEIHWSRWALLLRDDLAVTPEASFGGLYTGAPGVPGQNLALTDITPAFQTSDTILTGRVNRLNNTSLAEIDYSLTRRATLTVVGSYALLHFSDPGYLGSRAINASAGYNYALSPKNSLALIYDYSDVHFTNGATQETHLFQPAFGRKVTQRMSLQIAAGPQLLLSRNLGLASGQRWSWSLSGSLNYQKTRKTGYNVSYFHGITGGSGVYLGATSDTFGGSVNHKFTQFWSASVNSGYSRSAELASTIGVSPRFDTWFAGASLSHQIGRQIRIAGNYGYQRQDNAPGACPVASCGLSGVGRNVGSISVEWHPLAIQIE